MSNYKTHAERELALAGWYDEDAFYGDAVPKAVLELLDVFAKQGHSGMSAGIVSRLFAKLALFENITPITGEDIEWIELDYTGVAEMKYQNARESAIFKGADNKAYYINAIVFRDEEGLTFTSNGPVSCKDGTVLRSRQYIKEFPFQPKTFYVDVISTEVAPDDWEHVVKDETQLKEIFEYYNRFD